MFMAEEYLLQKGCKEITYIDINALEFLKYCLWHASL